MDDAVSVDVEAWHIVLLRVQYDKLQSDLSNELAALLLRQADVHRAIVTTRR